MLNDSVILDIEVYPNYFLAGFKSLRTGKVVTVESSTVVTKEQTKKLNSILSTKKTVGFNSWKYDMPLLHWIIENNPSVEKIYQMSKDIVEGGRKVHTLYNIYENPKGYDHIDISEPAPAVMVSLKGYGARIGSKTLWDLPYDPHKHLTTSEMEIVAKYNVNDLDTTIDLFNEIYPRLELREKMTEQYGIDLMSKSDAQIAEAVFVSELNYSGGVPQLTNNYSIKYSAPSCLEYKNADLENLLTQILNFEFRVGKNGSVEIPKSLANTKIVIGDTTYKIGIGGLHSQEKKLVVKSDKHRVLRNADVASYYPSMILEYKWFPKQFGEKFLAVYRNIYETRLEAKRKGDKVVDGSLKIVLNGSFGKLGSKYSKLYSPDLMLHVTLTGQLLLLMLIERLESYNIQVVSSNTDGVEYLCPRDKVDLAKSIILDWEIETGMTMEHGEYKALYARDVNNYVAIYEDEPKAKGIFTKQTLMKGRQCPIVFTAIRKYLFDGTRLEDTLHNEKDINNFVLSRTVRGGGVFNDTYLGKMVRWYWSNSDDATTINYSTNGNKVPLSDGCKPIMKFTSFPDDLDYDRYLQYAIENLNTMGVEYA